MANILIARIFFLMEIQCDSFLIPLLNCNLEPNQSYSYSHYDESSEEHLSQDTQFGIDIEIFDILKYINLGINITGHSQKFHHLVLLTYLIPLLNGYV
ncbi:hypothetical protein HZS_1955 [Henneguya salminicola]|nr:hypothetical protein HZS_1955 [Henneguya salminicola]